MKNLLMVIGAISVSTLIFRAGRVYGRLEVKEILDSVDENKTREYWIKKGMLNNGQ